MKKNNIILIIILACLIFTSCIKENDIAKIGEEGKSVSSSNDTQQTDTSTKKQSTEEKLTIDKLKELGYEIIDNQIIDIEYNNLSDTKLISAIYLQDDKGQLKFFVAKDNEIIYTFPEFSGNKDVSVLELKRVNSVDINNDDKKDIVFYASTSKKDDLNNIITEDICGNYLLEDDLFIEGESLWQELMFDTVKIQDINIKTNEVELPYDEKEKYKLQLKIPAKYEKDRDFEVYAYNDDSKTSGCILFGSRFLYIADWQEDIKEIIKYYNLNMIHNYNDDIDSYKIGVTKNGYEYAVKSMSLAITEPTQEITMLIIISNNILYNLRLNIYEYDLQIYDIEYMLNSIQLIEN